MTWPAGGLAMLSFTQSDWILINNEMAIGSDVRSPSNYHSSGICFSQLSEDGTYTDCMTLFVFALLILGILEGI